MIMHQKRFVAARLLTALGCLCGALTAHSALAQGPVVMPSSAPPSLSIGPAKPFSQLDPQPITHQVSRPVERLEMIVNTSRILTLEERIPQAQVNNPEILKLNALSPNQLQVSALKPGVTQVNIWDEKGSIRSLDVLVYGDVQELARLIQSRFPRAALKLTPISTGILIDGYVDDPNVQSQIIQLAQQYYPNVINSITIGGVQQVLLQVRVLEVSRTKLQSLGVDMAAILQNGSFFASGAAGLLRPAALVTSGAASTSGKEVLTGRIASNGDNFFVFVEALKQNNLAKIVADPNLTTVSGRPAFMNSGGEIPIIVPQSLGTVSIEYRRYGTQIDFVPIVLGNGVIRLEVYPRVSELDDSRGVTINGTTVPAFRVREANTGAELRAGQTLAIAGLVQTRIETATRGVPWVMDTPVVGTFFRRTTDQINEVELLIMVTPQIVDGLDPQDLCQIGPGPGTVTTNPGDCQLFVEGHIEVPPGSGTHHNRPAHMQQPFPIGANGAMGAASGVVVPQDVAPAIPRPAAESIPAGTPKAPEVILPPPTPTPAPAPTPPKPRATDSARAATTEQRRPALEAKIRAASAPAVISFPAESSMPGLIGPAPSVEPAKVTTAESSATPTTPAAPGLIGPVGYDSAK